MNNVIVVCRLSLVDSSVPSILPPRGRVPSTPSTLLSIYTGWCHAEKTKINKKRPVLAYFFKKTNVIVVLLEFDFQQTTK